MPSHTDQLLSSYVQRGEVTILLGSTPGRTQLLFQLLAHLQQPTSPTNFFGLPHATDCKIGLISLVWTPNSLREVADRTAFDLDAATWWHFCVAQPNRPWDVSMLKHGWSALQQQLDWAVTEGHPDIIVIDPLTDWAGVSPNQYNGVSTFMVNLNRWAREHYCAVIGTHILNRPTKNAKEGYRLAKDRVYGSKAWVVHTPRVMVLEGFDELYNEGDARQAVLRVYDTHHDEQRIALKYDAVGQWIPSTDSQKLDPCPITATEQTYLDALMIWLRDQGGRVLWDDLLQGITLTPFKTEETLKWIGKLAVLRGLITRNRSTGWALTPLGQSAAQATAASSDPDNQTIN